MVVLPNPPPADTEQFVAALRKLLADVVATRGEAVAIGGMFPNLSKLEIDLTRATPLSPPAATFTQTAGPVISFFTVDQVHFIGKPFGPPDQPLDVEASAQAFRGEFLQTSSGQTALRLAGAKNGSLRIAIARSTVQSLVLSHAAAAAAAQGVTIKEIDLSWRTQTPRTLFAQVHIKAKKGFLTAPLLVQGQVQIDDSLTVRLSNLSVEGEGIVGGVAAGMIRPKLQQAEGTTYSLLALPLDALELKDVQLQATADLLTVQAKFEG